MQKGVGASEIHRYNVPQEVTKAILGNTQVLQNCLYPKGNVPDHLCIHMPLMIVDR